MTYRLSLVTGATGGLGKALALALAKRKIPLLLTATREGSLRELADDLEQMTTVEIHVADLSSPSSREGLRRVIRERAPDLIINNAGFGLYGEALSYSTEDHAKLIEVNVTALVEITLEAARALLAEKKEGTILNISSAIAFFSVPYHASYSASKAFVNNFSSAFAREMQPHGIRVLISCPGQIDTFFRQRASRGHYTAKERHVISPEKAAEEILQQIDHGPTLRIIDRFYRIAIGFNRLLPRSLVERHLGSLIRRRSGNSHPT